MTRIAVVNNDTVFLDMMVAVLGERGWEVHAIREAEGAFDALTQQRPDLIILDIRMETPDAGWNLLELLTLDAEMVMIPVIVCSGALLDLRERQDWLRRFGIAVLPKPFDIATLYQQVESALSPRRPAS